MCRLTIITTLFLLFSFAAQAQKKRMHHSNMVQLEIITVNSDQPNAPPESKTISIDWPFPNGPLPVGGQEEVLKKIDTLLKANGVNCPPVRTALGNNIWLCGNGIKIRTNNPKLISLLTDAWSGNE
ncbi:MAG: hypothetical protein JWR12_2999 [Mucilaginibacter sp.]|nr:hypothetical protein [Mucilaginibacter sp.]